MKSTKKIGKQAPAKDAISRADAEAVRSRLAKMFWPNKERSQTFMYQLFDLYRKECEREDDEMIPATGLTPANAQVLCLLGQTLAARRRSTAQLVALGLSEEAMQLCTEALARGIREPAGDGHVLRFPRYKWRPVHTGPTPEEAPPEEEDETFAGTGLA